MTDDRIIGASASVVAYSVSSWDIRFNITKAFGAILESAINFYKYRKTVGELSNLSDHMLNDVGLHRSEIFQVTNDAIQKRARRYY